MLHNRLLYQQIEWSIETVKPPFGHKLKIQVQKNTVLDKSKTWPNLTTIFMSKSMSTIGIQWSHL